jgi:hypothetical protein
MADLSFGLSILFAFFLLGLAFLSIVSLVEFAFEGEVYVPHTVYVCIPFLLAILVTVTVVTVAIARTVLRSSTDPRALRAAYFLIGYPIILVSFLFATVDTGFAPSIAFGLPLFGTGVIAYPLACLIVRDAFFNVLSANILKVQCYACRYIFEMNRQQDAVRCPYCGEPNLNPLGPEPGEPPVDEPLDVEPMSGGDQSTGLGMLTRL